MSTSNTVDEAIALARGLVHAWGCWAPTLTSDATRVAFVSDRTGGPELWIADVEGDSEPRHVPLSDDPVLAVHWSPDGTWLSCAVATGGGVRQQVWVVRPDGTGARRVAGSAMQHAKLGPWARTGHRLVVGLAPTEPGEETRCVMIDPLTGEQHLLAHGDLIDVLDLSGDERFVLLRDGQRNQQFCVMVDLVADVDHPVLPYPETGSTDVGLLRPGPDGAPGSMVAYLSTDAGRPRHELIAQVIDSRGRRGPVGVLAHRDDAELEALDADADGRLLLLVWNVAGRSEVELYDTVTGARRSVSDIPGTVVPYAALARDGSRAVLAIESESNPMELWRLDTATGGLRRLFDSRLRVERELVRPTLETFVSHDGLTITGWLYRVPGRTGPGPAMLSLHGGPESQERPGFSAQHQVLLAAGIAVFAPNVRGSSGFGRAFVHADDRYGRRDAIGDVESCARHLVDIGVADPERIAVTGRSYGGYLTLAALTWYPKTFAAGVDICGMSDLLTFYRDTEPWIAAAAYSKYGHPTTDRTLLRDLSPMNFVDQIVAPLLVVHGELDTNVPLGEATQVVAALRALGRDVDYVELAGEGHEYRKAASRLVLLERLVHFLTDRLG